MLIRVIDLHTNPRKYKKRRLQMPQIFKALASSSAWILFIVGCLAILLPLTHRIIAGLFTGDILGIFSSMVALKTGIFALALSVAVMKLRKMLE